MNSPNRYLTRMALFIVVVTALAVLLGQGLIEAFLANPVLNGVIGFLLGVGIIYSLRTVWALKPEIAWLESFRGDLARPPEEFGPRQPVLLAPMARMLGERRGHLTLTAQGMTSLLDGISSRLSESREIGRYLIGLLVFLGLLGTFWGLLTTIGSVGLVIETLAVDQDGQLALALDALREGLRAPLAGMGTAFSSSLFGLAGSLILGFLELQASQAQNRFYNDVEDWLSSTTRLAGSFEGEGGGAYLQALAAQTAENLDRLTNSMAATEDNRRQLNLALLNLSDRMGALNDHLRNQQSAIGQIAKTQADLEPMIERLAGAIGTEGFGLDDATRDHIRSLDVKLTALVEAHPGNQRAMVDELRSEIRSVSRTIAALSEDQG